MCEKPEIEVTDVYYEDGIKIQVLKGFTGIKPRKHSEKPYTYENTSYCSNYFNRLLKEWCDVRNNRMRDLANNSHLSLSWFAKRKYGNKLLRQEEYVQHVKPAMLKTENQEKNSLSAGDPMSELAQLRDAWIKASSEDKPAIRQQMDEIEQQLHEHSEIHDERISPLCIILPSK